MGSGGRAIGSDGKFLNNKKEVGKISRRSFPSNRFENRGAGPYSPVQPRGFFNGVHQQPSSLAQRPAFENPANIEKRFIANGHQFPNAIPAPPIPTTPQSINVPGFGSNASIHELFAKMVWAKMEMIKDPQTVDRLQTQILSLINEEVAKQPHFP